LSEAVGLHTPFDAPIEHDLHADADAEHLAAAREAALDEFGAARAAERLHDGREGSDARYEQSVGVHDAFAIGTQLDACAGTLERLDGRVHVAGAVVEYDDGRAGHAQSAPLVDG